MMPLLRSPSPQGQNPAAVAGMVARGAGEKLRSHRTFTRSWQSRTNPAQHQTGPKTRPDISAQAKAPPSRSEKTQSRRTHRAKQPGRRSYKQSSKDCKGIVWRLNISREGSQSAVLRNISVRPAVLKGQSRWQPIEMPIGLCQARQRDQEASRGSIRAWRSEFNMKEAAHASRLFRLRWALQITR
jgi:hypothetical protein